MEKEKIAFIGLGHMGFPLAQILLQVGYPLSVYNRSKTKADSLIKEGAKLLDSPKQALEVTSIVVTMVTDDAALEQLVWGADGLGQALKAGDIHVSMSTVSPEMSRRMEDFHRERNAFYLAAPVLGRPEAVRNKKLWILLAGNSSAKSRVKPILEHLGQGIFDFGENAEKANAVKIFCNFLLFSAMETLAETLVLGKKCQIDTEQLLNLFSQALFPCATYQNYGKLIAQTDVDTGDFKTSLGFKDVMLLLKMAQEFKCPMPAALQISDRFLGNLAMGRENWDLYYSLAKSVNEAAGLSPRE